MGHDTFHRVQLGRNRTELQKDVSELAHRLATLADQLVRAAEAHDAATCNDLSIEMYDLDRKVEDASFLLALLDEATR
jgi:hypothetical protein